jgi:GntR family transcriptional regulator
MISGGNLMNKIDKKSRIPLYYQLMDIIVEKIDSGIYKENDKIPSERELCDYYQVSRSTVRKTLLELEKDGYIYIEHGKGTFVSPKRFKQDLLKFYSFSEEMKKIGKKPSSKVIEFNIINCNEKISKKMNIDIGDNIYKFIRLRLANDEPMMIETTYVPYNRFPGITKEDLENSQMYDIFMQRFKAKFNKAEEVFQPVYIREEEAKYLEVNRDINGMKIERITYENNNIIEYTTSIARGDKFKFHVVLEK